MKRGNSTLDAWLKAAVPVKKPCLGKEQRPEDCKQAATGKVLYTSCRKPKNDNAQAIKAFLKPASLLPGTSKSKGTSKSLANCNPMESCVDDTSVPKELVADLCFLADFNWTFSDLLKTQIVTVSQLYRDLIYPQASCRIHTFTVALVREATRSLTLRNEEDLISAEMPHFEVFHHLSSQLDFDLLADQLPFLLLSELLQSPAYHDEEEKASPALVDFQSFYVDWSVYEKVAVYKVLVCMTLDSPLLHDMLEDRLEERAKLLQTRSDHQGKLTAFNKERRGQHLKKGSADWLKRQDMKKEIALLREHADTIPLRTEPIGRDHWGNLYYLFEFDRNSLLIADSDQQNWRYVNSLSTIATLKKCLDPKVPEEKSLLEAVNLIESKETEEEISLETATDTEADLRANSLELLFKAEAKVSAFFTATGKWWGEERDLREWKSAVAAAYSPERLKELLGDFVEKANIPFKRSSPPDNLIKRVNLRLWAEFAEASDARERLWTRALSWEHLFALISCELAVFERHFHLKRKSFLSATAKAMKQLGTGVRTRRLTRMSEKLRVQELLADETHDDVCWVCEHGGDLMCCEGCPQVAHCACVGLEVRTR